jgi:AcrR family transcriptional regulator
MAKQRVKTKAGSQRRVAVRRRDIELPTALLAATEDILREHGLEKFTLREAARRAGVTHGAPAFHFGDVAGLLTAFAASGYKAMTALMLKYRLEAPKDPKSQLVAVGSAYIDYAIAHRPQFQLMFRSDRIDLNDDAYKECSKAAFQQLQETMMPLLRRESTDEERKLKMMLAWSAVHGFATLVLEKRFTPFYGNNQNPTVLADSRRILEILTASF